MPREIVHVSSTSTQPRKLRPISPVSPKVAVDEQPKQRGKVGNFIDERGRDIKALTTGDVSVSDVIFGMPKASVKVGKAISSTLLPSATEFVKTTGGIIGEGLAYASSKNVREQYRAGNLDILPNVTKTTQKDLLKKTAGAGLEATVLKLFPTALSKGIAARSGIGALEGVGFAVAEGLSKGQSAEEIVDNMKLYGVSGAAINAVTPVLLPFLRKEIGKGASELRAIKEEADRVVKLPAKPAVNGSSPVKVNTPNTKHAEYSKRMGYEPYTPSEQLPVIQMGNKPAPKPGELPTIQIGEANQVGPTPPSGMKYVPEVTTNKPEPVSLPQTANRLSSPVKVTEPVVDEATRVSVPSNQMPVGSGKTQVSSLEKRLTQLSDDPLVQRRLSEADLPTYNRSNQREQMGMAAKLVENDPDRALRIALGQEPPPPGVLQNSVAIALEKQAINTIDPNLIIRVSSLRSTRLGQEIAILRQADAINPADAIYDIHVARAGRSLRQSGKKITENTPAEEIVAEIKKERKAIIEKGGDVSKVTEIKIEEAEKLLNSILC